MSPARHQRNIRNYQPRLERTETVLSTPAAARSTAAPSDTATMRTTGARPTGAHATEARPTGACATAARATAARATGARATEALDRDALLDRLHQLRAVLPAFAQELADVRRAAAKLRVDNRRLLAEVHRLQKERGERSRKRVTVA